MMAPQVEQALTRELHPPLPAGEVLVEADRCLACGGPYAAVGEEMGPADTPFVLSPGVDASRFRCRQLLEAKAPWLLTHLIRNPPIV